MFTEIQKIVNISNVVQQVISAEALIFFLNTYVESFPYNSRSNANLTFISEFLNSFFIDFVTNLDHSVLSTVFLEFCSKNPWIVNWSSVFPLFFTSSTIASENTLISHHLCSLFCRCLFKLKKISTNFASKYGSLLRPLLSLLEMKFNSNAELKVISPLVQSFGVLALTSQDLFSLINGLIEPVSDRNPLTGVCLLVEMFKGVPKDLKKSLDVTILESCTAKYLNFLNFEGNNSLDFGLFKSKCISLLQVFLDVFSSLSLESLLPAFIEKFISLGNQAKDFVEILKLLEKCCARHVLSSQLLHLFSILFVNVQNLKILSTSLDCVEYPPKSEIDRESHLLRCEIFVFLKCFFSQVSPINGTINPTFQNHLNTLLSVSLSLLFSQDLALRKTIVIFSYFVFEHLDSSIKVQYIPSLLDIVFKSLFVPPMNPSLITQDPEVDVFAGEVFNLILHLNCSQVVRDVFLLHFKQVLTQFCNLSDIFDPLITEFNRFHCTTESKEFHVFKRNFKQFLSTLQRVS
ncbi:hypothetical protein GEMRC1_001726 [Eukaryota sp. GEM-RC1]